MCCCCFFKQKTAYEMRISDWSSDVCSSDLLTGDVAFDVLEFQLHFAGIEGQWPVEVVVAVHGRHFLALGLEETLADAFVPLYCVENAKIGRASCRESVCQYV